MTEPVDAKQTPGEPGGQAPATPDAQVPPAQTPAPHQPAATLGRRPALMVALIAVVVLATDQVSKNLAVQHLSGGERIDLIGSLFGLRLTRNPGAAFSMATGSTWIFTIIATVVVIVIVRMSSRLASYGWALAFGLLLGGALGNLTDRLTREPGFARGHVVDFLEFPHWPIFNVADCCVVSAAALIALFSLTGLGMDGQRVGRDG
jgi:signal peptidase II